MSILENKTEKLSVENECLKKDCHIAETAKANGLDVFKYFELLLTVLPSMEFLTNPDILNELLPWNESVQKICKVL